MRSKYNANFIGWRENHLGRGCNIWRSNGEHLGLDEVSNHWKSRQSRKNIITHQMNPRSMLVSRFRRNKEYRTFLYFPHFFGTAKWGYSQPLRDERSHSKRFEHSRLSKPMALELETVQHQTSSPASIRSNHQMRGQPLTTHRWCLAYHPLTFYDIGKEINIDLTKKAAWVMTASWLAPIPN